MDAAHFSVGLTGGIGSGKTTVANMFAARGAAVIDTDQIAHALTAPGGLAIPAIRSRFGDQVITSSGALDRARMREIVFADTHARQALEAILHPLIRAECEQAAGTAQGDYLIFVVPLLIESGQWRRQVSRILVVDCPETQQVNRVMARNGLEESQVRAIMATQASRAERLAAADDVLENHGDPASLGPEVNRLHDLYRSLAGKSAHRTIPG